MVRVTTNINLHPGNSFNASTIRKVPAKRTVSITASYVESELSVIPGKSLQRSPPSQRFYRLFLLAQLGFPLFLSPPGVSPLPGALPGARNERGHTSGSLLLVVTHLPDHPRPTSSPTSCIYWKQQVATLSKLLLAIQVTPDFNCKSDNFCCCDSVRRRHLLTPKFRSLSSVEECQNACHPLSCITWARTFAGKPPGLLTRSNGVLLPEKIVHVKITV